MNPFFEVLGYVPNAISILISTKILRISFVKNLKKRLEKYNKTLVDNKTNNFA